LCTPSASPWNWSVPASPEVAKPLSASPWKSGVCLRRLKLPSLSFAQRVCTCPRPSTSRPQTMAVACGADFTIALTDNGDVWSMGEGEDGQLGLGTTWHQNKPAWVGGRDVFKEPVVLVAAGSTHAACVTSKGVLYTWGNGKHGELGDGFQEIRLYPQQINLAGPSGLRYRVAVHSCQENKRS